MQDREQQAQSNLSLVTQVAKAFFSNSETHALNENLTENTSREIEIASPEEIQEIHNYIDSKRLCMKRRADDEIFFQDKSLPTPKDFNFQNECTEKKSKSVYTTRKIEKWKVHAR